MSARIRTSKFQRSADSAHARWDGASLLVMSFDALDLDQGSVGDARNRKRAKFNTTHQQHPPCIFALVMAGFSG
jgi:hypothetical protein